MENSIGRQWNKNKGNAVMRGTRPYFRQEAVKTADVIEIQKESVKPFL